MAGVGGADSTRIIAERLAVFAEAEGETPASGSNYLFYFFHKWGQLTINNYHRHTERKNLSGWFHIYILRISVIYASAAQYISRVAISLRRIALHCYTAFVIKNLLVLLSAGTLPASNMVTMPWKLFSSTPSSFDSRKTQWHRAVLLWVPLINPNCQTLLVKGKWDIKKKKKKSSTKERKQHWPFLQCSLSSQCFILVQLFT